MPLVILLAYALGSIPSALLLARGTKRPARAFGLAAARETLEEVGLRLGGPAGPALDKLRFIFRAITPPNRARRFDARFFLAEAGEVLLDDTPAGGDELLDVKWFSFEEAEKPALIAPLSAVAPEADPDATPPPDGKTSQADIVGEKTAEDTPPNGPPAATEEGDTEKERADTGTES